MSFKGPSGWPLQNGTYGGSFLKNPFSVLKTSPTTSPTGTTRPYLNNPTDPTTQNKKPTFSLLEKNPNFFISSEPLQHISNTKQENTNN